MGSRSGVYTPQYIARFFGRFLQENHTPPRFRNLTVVDPACGSGIFLRTILEMQCDPRNDELRATARIAYENTLGIDADENACKAARLSLALLYLVVADELPKTLRIEHSESVKYVSGHKELIGAFDVVVANPPYVTWENIAPEWQKRIDKFLAEDVVGKPDLYLAFIRLGIELLKDGGFLLYVLPHTFLVARKASRIRKKVAEEFWIHFIADLSDINVFEDVNAYPVLLIAQKKRRSDWPTTYRNYRSLYRLCWTSSSRCVSRRTAARPQYSIFTRPQDAFLRDNWRTISSNDFELQGRLEQFPRLEEFLDIKQGFISGMDKVFIRKKEEVPVNERDIYVPFLGDKEMEKFATPKQTPRVVFYPFEGDKELNAHELEARYPLTWNYLCEHKEALTTRKSVRTNPATWWRPIRPRAPKQMMRRKIISPHLVLLPKFSVDLTGKFAISRSPLMYPHKTEQAEEMLKYFLAILNSSVAHWQIFNTSHKYRQGYAMLEPITLKSIRVPSPATVQPRQMNRIQKLVDKQLQSPEDLKNEVELDKLIAELYGIDLSELRDGEIVSA